jgi:uncharacterized protein YjbI with pentapeptide repeats
MPCNATDENGSPFGWCRDETRYPVVYKDDRIHYCVFHAPKDNKFKALDSNVFLSPKEFNDLVLDEIDRAKRENRDCNLSGSVLPWDISFIRYSRHGKTNGKDNPLPEISFSRTEFGGKASFETVRFGGRANFHFSRFRGKASFYDAKFSGEAEFGSAKFGDEAVFWRTDFGGTAAFGQLKFEEMGRVTFRDLTLERPSFIGVDFRKCDFIAVKWKQEGGRFVLYDEALLRGEIWRKLSKSEYNLLRPLKWLALLVREFFSPSNEMKIRAVEHLYREMKLKAGEMNDHYSYSHWHQSEKEMQYLRASIKHPFHFAAIKLYSLLSGFGENPARAFFVLIVLILLSAVWFGLVGLKPSKGRGDTVRIEEATDLFVPKTAAALPLTTLQYAIFEKDPTYQPANTLGQYLKVLVKILIPIQAALFAFALRNRFRR